MEWNIIALERAGIDMGVDKEALSLLLYKRRSWTDEYGDRTADGKPTDLERTAWLWHALGLESQKHLEMSDGSTVDLIQWILDNESDQRRHQ